MGSFLKRFVCFGIASALAFAAASPSRADPVSPTGWTSNIQLGVPLPQGWYFIEEAYYLKRSGADMLPGLDEVDAIVNIPVLAWSTPGKILGGRLEAIVFTAELGVGINPAKYNGTSSWHRDFYNPAGLIGLAWDLGGGWSMSNFVGGFTPVDTDIGNNLSLGGNFWTFADLLGLAYNKNGWSLSANFIYLHSGNDLDTGLYLQPDTFDVDFAFVKHINKWELGMVGSAATDLNSAIRNNNGLNKFKEFSLGGLLGYTFGSVTTEIFATRSIEAENMVAGGKDTRFWTRIVIPLYNPPAQTAAAQLTSLK